MSDLASPELIAEFRVLREMAVALANASADGVPIPNEADKALQQWLGAGGLTVCCDAERAKDEANA